MTGNDDYMAFKALADQLDNDATHDRTGSGPHPAVRLVTDTDAAPARVVKGPGDPLPNARTFLNATYNQDGRELLVHWQGTWHAWDGRCWPELDRRTLSRDLYAFFDTAIFYKSGPRGGSTPKETPFQPTRNKVADLLHALEAVVHLPADTDAPSWTINDPPAPADELLPCANGLLHLPTRRLLDHDPRLFNLHAVPFAHDPNATCPRWETFLGQLWPDDPQSIAAVQEMFGYLVSGDTRLQKAFFLVGPKRSGKGTIGRVATALIGPADVAGPSMGAFASHFGLSALIGKRLAIVGDARIRANDDEIVQRVLSIVGEDVIDVDRKHRDPWHGRLPTRLLLLSNELPSLVDSSGALASRFVLLRLTRSFIGKEDHHLEDTLVAELPGILNWALDGMDRLRRRGRFVIPDSSLELMTQLEDLASPISAFVRDRCTVDPMATVSCDTLYIAWRRWCADEGRTHPGKAATFGKDLFAAFPQVSKSRPRAADGNRTWTYTGIGLPGSQEAL